MAKKRKKRKVLYHIYLRFDPKPHQVERHIGADFCLIFGGEIQQAGEIAKVNQYCMP